MMSSSEKKSNQKEKDLIEAIQRKDISATHELIDDLIAGEQLVMPGFGDFSRKNDPEKERHIRGILQKLARQMKVPSNVFLTAYGRYPNLNVIANALASQNAVDSLRDISPRLYTPLRPARAYRVSNPKDAWNYGDGREWMIQQKMDGWYGQIHGTQGKVIIYSRNGEVLSFASTIEGKLSDILRGDNAIFECELVGVNKTGNIAPRVEIKSTGNYVRAYFFDLLYWNGDLTRRPYEERFSKLNSILSSAQDDILQIITCKRVNSENDFVSSFEEWNNLNGLEGMIAKRPYEIYEADCEARDFLKIKIKDTVDAIVMGYMENPRSYLLGLLNDENDFVPFVWVTVPVNQTDILADEIKYHIQPDAPPISAGGRITEFQTKVSIVVEVEGDKIYKNDKYECGKKQTGNGWSLFEAKISQIRTDKGPNDITSVEAFLKLNRMAGYTKQ